MSGTRALPIQERPCHFLSQRSAINVRTLAKQAMHEFRLFGGLPEAAVNFDWCTCLIEKFFSDIT